MPDESIDRLLKELPPEELRKRLTVEQRLEGLSAEDFLKALAPETLRELMEKLKTNRASPKPE